MLTVLGERRQAWCCCCYHVVHLLYLLIWRLFIDSKCSCCNSTWLAGPIRAAAQWSLTVDLDLYLCCAGVQIKLKVISAPDKQGPLDAPWGPSKAGGSLEQETQTTEAPVWTWGWTQHSEWQRWMKPRNDWSGIKSIINCSSKWSKRPNQKQWGHL